MDVDCTLDALAHRTILYVLLAIRECVNCCNRLGTRPRSDWAKSGRMGDDEKVVSRVVASEVAIRSIYLLVFGDLQGRLLFAIKIVKRCHIMPYSI